MKKFSEVFEIGQFAALKTGFWFIRMIIGDTLLIHNTVLQKEKNDNIQNSN